jgi:hypothetical protein
VVKKIKLLFETIVWANSLLNYLKKTRGGECLETGFWEKHKKRWRVLLIVFVKSHRINFSQLGIIFISTFRQLLKTRF